MNLNAVIVEYETTIRLSFFAGMFVLMAGWELLAPRRQLTVSKSQRWAANLGLVVLNSVVLRLVFPLAATGVAVLVNQNGWGLMNVFSLPYVVAVGLSVVVLDFFIYLQHVMVHAIPVLWRLHRVHHADLDFDVTTGSRFHPLEIILSMLIKFTVILLLGPPVLAVIVFEILLNASAMFNHSNVRLPLVLDRGLRWFLVTPDMHRVHHSVEDDEANSNFGFCLPWWDRLLGTYRDQPRAGHGAMQIGIHGYSDPRQVATLPGILTLPFIGKITAYALNRRFLNNPDNETQNEK